MKEKVKANKKEIKKLRKIAGIQQSYFVTKREGFSYRQYQRAEAGEKINKEVLASIAKFYDKYLKKHKGYKENIFVDQIINDEKMQINEISIYLHNVKGYEEISKIISQASFQKIFYPINPNPIQADLITKLVREFKRIHDELKKPKRKNFDTDKFSDIETELLPLSDISNFGSLIDLLRKQGLFLYSNNFKFPYIGKGHVVNEENTYGAFESFASTKNYSIFCFKDYDAASLIFKYETEYNLENLKKLVKSKPWSADDSVYVQGGTAEEEAENEFNHTYSDFLKQHGNTLNKSKVNILKPDTDVYTADDYLGDLSFIRDECYEIVINDKRFYNYYNSEFSNEIIKPIKIDSPENKNFKTREKLIKKSKWVLREDIEHLSMYMFGFDDRDKNKTIKYVSELILNSGKKLKEALEKARPTTEMP